MTVAGTFLTTVLHSGTPIKGSPFTTIVEPGLTNPATSTGSGNGIVGGTAGDRFAISVQAKDRYYNDQARPSAF